MCGTRNKGTVGKFMVCVVHVIRGTVCVEIYGLCGTRNKGTVGKFMVCVVHVIRGQWGNLWFVWYT